MNRTRSLAIQLVTDHINVNAVCPGGVMTAMSDQFMQVRPQLGDEMIRSRLLRRPLQPEDIGYAVATGQVLNVDGGYVFN